jgi:hypothetical protein
VSHLFSQAFIDEAVRNELDFVGFSFLDVQDFGKLAIEEKIHGLIRTSGKGVVPHVIKILVWGFIVLDM